MLSMFAGFDFAWPSALLSLYHSLSLFNFNFDLLAPECSVSLNYETKWYIIQSLPAILLLGIVVVVVATRMLQWVQVQALGRLPFGALSTLNLIDVCIGVFISGLFMLYFGASATLVLLHLLITSSPAPDVVSLIVCVSRVSVRICYALYEVPC